jgi:hypothetical protein
VTFQPSDAFQQVRVPQPSHAQPGDSSRRNRFASSPVSHGLRHLASVSKSPPLRLTSSRSRRRACSWYRHINFSRWMHSRHAQAASPPYGRATLAGRTFGSVGEPFLIRGGRTEITIDEILRRGAYFSTIGAVATSSGRGSGQTSLSHQTSHVLLRDEDPLPAQCGANLTIAVAAVIAFEDVCDDATRTCIPVSDKQTCSVIEAGTAGKSQDG